MAGRLEGRAALVTGGASGLGEGTVRLFAREGASVLLVGRDADSVKETQGMIADGGGKASVCRADVTRGEDCRRMTERCVAAYGCIDVLHNNVGIGDLGGPVELSEEDWERVFATNLKSMFLTCKHVLPHMERQGSGAIVNISSLGAVRFAPYPMLSYSASKAGVNAFTHALATGNAKHGIRANAILPGLMNTPMAIENISKARGIAREQLIAARDSQVPLLQKMGTAWDVAYAALFLASDEARFITGVLLPVDGGQSARIG